VRVHATAGDHEFVRTLGADAAIDYSSTDYVDAVAEMTRGKGVDVVFTRQNRGKLDALTTLVERGLVKPVIELPPRASQRNAAGTPAKIAVVGSESQGVRG
jgi:NADPH:quinone reductase-like Zn-dependent oxidoreductase